MFKGTYCKARWCRTSPASYNHSCPQSIQQGCLLQPALSSEHSAFCNVTDHSSLGFAPCFQVIMSTLPKIYKHNVAVVVNYNSDPTWEMETHRFMKHTWQHIIYRWMTNYDLWNLLLSGPETMSKKKMPKAGSMIKPIRWCMLHGLAIHLTLASQKFQFHGSNSSGSITC